MDKLLLVKQARIAEQLSILSFHQNNQVPNATYYD